MIIKGKHFDKFIMVAPGSDYGVAMWSDIKNVENAVFLDYVIETDNKIIQLLHHIHFSFGINSYVQLPFQNIWKKYYTIQKLGINTSERICIIFTDISACRTDTKYLNYLHSLSNVTMVMVLVNVLSSKGKLLKKRFKYFDQIYSFDSKDCQEYGFTYYPTFYSITRVPSESGISSTDAFFVGISKGNRYSILKKLYVALQKNNGTADFYISRVKKEQRDLEGIHYDEWLSYKEVLDRVMDTNCVVEIMGDTQSGLTLRTMEAIVFNKKLLTNNESVKELHFYNTGHIQYFSNIEDVNIEFVLDKTPVDYHYNGEFSPIHLLERINELAT